MNQESLPGAFGKKITEIDLAEATNDELREVLEVFHDNGLILLPNQDLTLAKFEEISAKFGDIKPHFIDHLRMPEHPGILFLSNIIDEGRPIGVYKGAAFWHTDVAYQDPPNTATLVYGVEYPKGGCPTYFASTILAYDALSDEKKKEIDDLRVIHHYGNRDDMDENSAHSAEKLTDEQKARIENVYHPLVARHHITGRKSLYGVAGSSFGIAGMSDEDGISLLDELKEHTLQPQFQTVLEIQPGDFAAWDAFSTLHKATAQKEATKPDERRLLWRTSLVGKPTILEA